MGDIPRLPDGRFPPGVSGGRNGGRKRKATTVDDALHEAFAEKIVVVEGGKRRKVDKLSATAKQIANEGATGKNARAAFSALQKAAQRKQAVPPAETLTASDQEIVDRFLFEYLRQVQGGQP